MSWPCNDPGAFGARRGFAHRLAGDASMRMQELQNEYVIGSIMIDFFSEVLELAYRAKAYPDEEAYI